MKPINFDHRHNKEEENSSDLSFLINCPWKLLCHRITNIQKQCSKKTQNKTSDIYDVSLIMLRKVLVS